MFKCHTWPCKHRDVLLYCIQLGSWIPKIYMVWKSRLWTFLLCYCALWKCKNNGKKLRELFTIRILHWCFLPMKWNATNKITLYFLLLLQCKPFIIVYFFLETNIPIKNMWRCLIGFQVTSWKPVNKQVLFYMQFILHVEHRKTDKNGKKCVCWMGFRWWLAFEH